MVNRFTILTVTVLVTFAVSASAVCNQRGTSTAPMYGCGGTDMCKHDTTADTVGSANNNLCCQWLAGAPGAASSQCVKQSQTGAPGSFTCYTQSTAGLCPKAFSLNAGGTNSYGRYTCTSDVDCADATDGRTRCVQVLPSQWTPGYKQCQP